MKHSVLSACIYLLFLQLLQSCIFPRYSLNKEEEAFVEKSTKFETISILYDKAAIRHLKDNGVYTIRFEKRSLYYQDTMTLKVSAIIAAIAVSKFMNFKEHYKYIDVVFYGADAGKQKNAFGENAESSCTIRMPLNNISTSRILNYFNTDFVTDGRQSR